MNREVRYIVSEMFFLLPAPMPDAEQKKKNPLRFPLECLLCAGVAAEDPALDFADP